MIYFRLNSAVDLRRVDVETADQSDQVREHDTLAELIDDGHGGKGSRPNAHPVRILATIADDIKAHIAARRFDPSVAFTSGRPEFSRHLGNRRPLGHHLQTLA